MFLLEPRANGVECGVIAGILGAAMLTAMIALAQPTPPLASESSAALNSGHSR